MNYEELIEKTVNQELIRVVLSKSKMPDEISKLSLRPIKVKDKVLYQITKTVGSKKSNTCREIHENFSLQDVKKELRKLIPDIFLQGLFETDKEGYTVLANKKGTVTVVKNKSVTGVNKSMEHNRTKNYLIPEGIAVPFMVDLGVMTPDGKITKAKYDKFRQINRYLEFVDDVYDNFDKDRELTIIDFGCGKSYLTFALFYYLVVLKNIKAHIIGLDLKTDVIKECNRLKNKYHYDGLEFIEGDIEHFEGVEKVDMVMSLHACDTATDYALYKALKWDAKVIMAVPCCQHEVNKNLNSKVLEGATQYGILKERMSAIFTDAMRANVLKESGYDTQILEFIDLDHTPKNLLIRAVKSGKKIQSKESVKKAEDLINLAGTKITLLKLLEE